MVDGASPNTVRYATAKRPGSVNPYCLAIVAMPDPRLGERACAFVVLREGSRFDFNQMQHYLYACQASKHYWPERLEIVDALPRTPSGKVQKYLLRERARDLRPYERDKASVS